MPILPEEIFFSISYLSILKLIWVTNLCISRHDDVYIMSFQETFVKADNSNCQIRCRWSCLECLPSFLEKIIYVLLQTKNCINDLHLGTL